MYYPKSPSFITVIISIIYVKLMFKYNSITHASYKVNKSNCAE